MRQGMRHKRIPAEKSGFLFFGPILNLKLEIMETRLFVLLDFSVYSKGELILAKKWAEWYGFEIIVLHQMDVVLPSLADKDLRLKITYDQKIELGKLWFDLHEEVFGQSYPVKFEILNESVISFLENNLDPTSNDLIIMGLKGSGKLKQIFIGSMVNMVVEQLNQLTIAVPKNLEIYEPNTLIISVHTKFPLNENAFEKFLKIIPKSIQSLKFISVLTDQDDEITLKAYLSMLTEKHVGEFEVSSMVFSGNNPLNEIKNHFEGRNDIFLMVQKGSRSFTDKLFRKFMVNELVYDGSIPLIILPS